MKLSINTDHTIADQIIANITNESDEHVAKIILSDDAIAEIKITYDALNELPVVNATHLLAIVLSALADATDEDTDIPLCVDTSVEI